jgi:hypothetical protein
MMAQKGQLLLPLPGQTWALSYQLPDTLLPAVLPAAGRVAKELGMLFRFILECMPSNCCWNACRQQQQLSAPRLTWSGYPKRQAAAGFGK